LSYLLNHLRRPIAQDTTGLLRARLRVAAAAGQFLGPADIVQEDRRSQQLQIGPLGSPYTLGQGQDSQDMVEVVGGVGIAIELSGLL
jgi:hypothetical protein